MRERDGLKCALVLFFYTRLFETINKAKKPIQRLKEDQHCRLKHPQNLPGTESMVHPALLTEQFICGSAAPSGLRTLLLWLGPATAHHQPYHPRGEEEEALRESTMLLRIVCFGDTLAKMNHKIIALSDLLFLETENWRGKLCWSFQSA